MKISVLESLFNKVDSKDIKEAPTQVFSGEYCKIFKNTFFTEHLQLLFKKIRTFPGKHQWWRLNTFIFLISTTEYNQILISY